MAYNCHNLLGVKVQGRGKAGKAAALTKFLDTITISQPVRHPLALPWLKKFRDYAPSIQSMTLEIGSYFLFETYSRPPSHVVRSMS